jgi:hypothetical protein
VLTSNYIAPAYLGAVQCQQCKEGSAINMRGVCMTLGGCGRQCLHSTGLLHDPIAADSAKLQESQFSARNAVCCTAIDGLQAHKHGIEKLSVMQQWPSHAGSCGPAFPTFCATRPTPTFETSWLSWLAPWHIHRHNTGKWERPARQPRSISFSTAQRHHSKAAYRRPYC